MECFVLGKFMTNREKLQYTVTFLADLISLIVSYILYTHILLHLTIHADVFPYHRGTG